MLNRFAIKDHFRETQLFNNRSSLALVLTTLLTFVLIGRLIYLQVFDHEHFSTLSQENRVNLVSLPPTRGLIYDRNGVLLAQNLPAFGIEVIPEQVHDIDMSLKELASIIKVEQDDIDRFHRLRKQKPAFSSVPLRFRLSDKEVALFAVNRHRFPGFDVVARLMRNYPLKNTTVHTLGYVGRINAEEVRKLDSSNYSGTTHIGKIGIEKAYEDTLHGTVGIKHVEVNATGRVLRILKQHNPQPGQDLILTIDSRLQQLAEQALGENRGAIVALNPNNGDVLAFVSTPTYDPNLFVMGIDKAAYEKLQGPDRPLFNRALRGQYPPGSTIKPFMGLAGLEYNKADENTKIFCPGWFTLRGDPHRYRDWKKTGHGHVHLNEAIVESCDVFFYDLSLTLGIDLIHTFLGKFGFGETTGIDITGEQSALLPSREWKRRVHNQVWYPGETLISGIGQGYTLATPLQLAVASAALANQGKRIKPRIVQSIHNLKNNTTTHIAPESPGTIHFANPNHWSMMTAAMIDVVHGRRGTARKIGEDASYIIAGKTGTAQVFSIKQDEQYVEEDVALILRDHALFIAFAPADKPEIAIAVIVENGGSGSATAAPIARTIMDQYLLQETPTNAK
ncbi:Peptidoglycan D,D-transpeptidase MrdA [hydrothermal vent metagenome]|uniref:Peptidoglycan D,D-transpeptidase MrdA n=1 Tax=hydrothermal vent metagenome TaxID=652676 RepID=A0A3B0Z1K1_9ZZZZ